MSRILYLHSGHHGKGTGAHGYMDEGEETIRLCNAIAKHLKCKFVLSKPAKLTTALIDSINSKFGDKAVICDIHFNSASPAAEGTEVFVAAKASTLSQEIAHSMLLSVNLAMGNSCRGVKPDSMSQYGKLAILSDTDSPAILVEPCFVSNKRDVERYRANFDKLAKAIADVLNSFCR